MDPDSTILKKCLYLFTKVTSAITDRYGLLIDALYHLHTDENERKGDTKREVGIMQKKMEEELKFAFMVELWNRLLSHKTIKGPLQNKIDIPYYIIIQNLTRLSSTS